MSAEDDQGRSTRPRPVWQLDLMVIVGLLVVASVVSLVL
jgi:hypothetical protein